jgi:hypothetical protein
MALALLVAFFGCCGTHAALPSVKPAAAPRTDMNAVKSPPPPAVSQAVPPPASPNLLKQTRGRRETFTQEETHEVARNTTNQTNGSITVWIVPHSHDDTGTNTRCNVLCVAFPFTPPPPTHTHTHTLTRSHGHTAARSHTLHRLLLHNNTGWLETVDGYYMTAVNWVLSSVVDALRDNPDRKHGSLTGFQQGFVHA